MHRHSAYSPPTRQCGATLVIALLVLVLIMMLGIAAVNTSDTQFKLAGNLQFEDSAMNNAETAVAAAESWLATGTNHANAGFTTANAANTPQLVPSTGMPSPLSMTWGDANSLAVAGNTSQRYFIQLLSVGNTLQGSSQVVGGRKNTVCNKVNTYQVTARGASARGATKFVQTYYSVLSC